MTLADRVIACLMRHGESLTASQIAVRIGEPTVAVREILASDPRVCLNEADGRYGSHGFVLREAA